MDPDVIHIRHMRTGWFLALGVLSACTPPAVSSVDVPVQAPDPGLAVEAPRGRLPMPMGNPDQCTDQDVVPGASYPRLLTRTEYDNTLRDLFGLDVAHDVAFPPENETLGFANGTSHAASSLLVELYLKASERAARRGLGPGSRYADHPCVGHGDAGCVGDFVADFATRAFRRPLVDEEKLILGRVYDELAPALGHREALIATLEAVLQSPQFLYRVERGTLDDSGAFRTLDSYELASRLSYFLWASMPDDALFEAAARDELSTEAGLVAQARRMLSDDKAASALREFHAQWLGLAQLHVYDKDPDVFDGYDPSWRSAWADSVLSFITHETFFAGGDFEALYTSNAVYTDATLAPLYGLPESNDMARHALPPDVYGGGLLTQPGLLAALANANQTSPIKRGVFVREHILCEVLPDPPADVPIVPPDPDPNATTRERFAAHTAEESCRDCHELIDPVGFGFEGYDALGRHRTEENGLPIDDSGSLMYTWSMDSALEGDFHGPVELAGRIGKSDQARDCYATQWFRYALGRAETGLDVCNLGVVRHKFEQHENVRELLLDIVRMPAFRTRDLGEVLP